MQTAAVSATTGSATTGPAAMHAGAKQAVPHKSAFHTLLSELNPLQYLPVVGTLYRAITGDTIPEGARFAGSLVVSGLTGGPIGVALNVGATALEHVLGIDPEKIGNHLLADLGIGAHAAPVQMASAGQPSAATDQTAAKAWSAAQLSAYGITSTAGQFTRGTVSGADVLNNLELARLGGTGSDSAFA